MCPRGLHLSSFAHKSFENKSNLIPFDCLLGIEKEPRLNRYFQCIDTAGIRYQKTKHNRSPSMYIVLVTSC